MLQIPQTPNFVINNGREFSRRLRGLNARQRAAIAIKLETGETQISNLTRSQSAAVAKVSPATIGRTQHPQQSAPSDEAIARTIARLGRDRVMRALDRMPAPEFQNQTQGEMS